MDRAGLYVHVPFCRSKCDYCDFHSVVATPALRAEVIHAVVAELLASPAGRTPTLRASTLFVGGGTPTALETDELAVLMRALETIAARDSAEEFTVETNPALLNEENVRLLRSAGVTRLSVGVQSWQPEELAVLGRGHRPEDVCRTFALARAGGFEHLACDLIFGIPGQTTKTWADTLRRTIDLGAEHISCYGLTYEAGTKLYARVAGGLVARCSEDIEAALYEQAIDTLRSAGFEHYEISNFARPGARCLHNLGCWRNEPYVGVGPSASGFIDGVRYRNVADLHEYVRRVRVGASPVCESERLERRAAQGEAAMLSLRLIEGIDRAGFRRRYGADPAELFQAAIPRHVSGGHLEVTPTHIRLTRRGLLVADAVMGDFLMPDDEPQEDAGFRVGEGA